MVSDLRYRNRDWWKMGKYWSLFYYTSLECGDYVAIVGVSRDGEVE